MSSSYWITKCSIQPSRLVVYHQYQGERRYNTAGLQFSKSLQRVQSDKSRKRMRNALELLLHTSKWKSVYVKSTQTSFFYRNSFITLTLTEPQKHTDEYIIKEMLSKFLEAWKKRRPALLYCWKAEVQDNGNIHFHITTNTFFLYKDLNKRWNNYLKKNGYKESINSTDVRAVSDKTNLVSYLVAYYSKKDLYTKLLKRWLKIYKNKLLKNQIKTDLPKNYFKNIKRKLNCVKWSASKILLDCKVSCDYDQNMTDWKMLERLKDLDQCAQSDYTISYFLEHSNQLKKYFPNFNKLLLKRLKPLTDLQNIDYQDVIERI